MKRKGFKLTLALCLSLVMALSLCAGISFSSKADSDTLTIVYDGNGATSGSTKSVQVSKNEEFVTISECGYKNPGKVFVGWDIYPQKEVPTYQPGQKATVKTLLMYAPNDTVTLYAIWRDASDTWTLKFDSGSGGQATGTTPSITGLTQASTVIIPECGYKWDGHVFKCWKYTNGSSSMTFEPGETVAGGMLKIMCDNDNKGATLVAQWHDSTDTFNVEFDGNDATSGSTPSIKNKKMDDTIVIPECGYEKVGYKFAGWTDYIGETGKVYMPGVSVTIADLFDGTTGTTKKLYAMWEEDDTGKAMYRLYNPNSGEHFYTADETERVGLINSGWNDEGTAWYAPSIGDPVYRLYNPNSGDHHYTLSVEEKNNLVAAGWNYEGEAWYSGGDVEMFRLYNPNAVTGSHHYTSSQGEIDSLVAAGWQFEGYAWSGLR